LPGAVERPCNFNSAKSIVECRIAALFMYNRRCCIRESALRERKEYQ
jgi:hypothetical protein